MSKTFLYLTVGVFAFLISLSIIYYFAYRSSYNLETSRNICQKCLDISKTENIETKTFSEILSNKSLQGKKVRVKALFSHDAGYIFLQDLNSGKDTVPTGFDRNEISCTDTKKTLQICTGYKTWYDSSVEVTVVGYLGKIDEESNSFQGGENGFNIVCIEQVNPTEKDLRNGTMKFNKNPFSFLFN
jgi:hypothetical protein